MTPTASTPAVIYTRVSSREQGESGLGLESQEERCRAECERRGWQVAQVVREVISGDKARRPLFDEATATAREIGGVLVGASIDRIARGGPMTVLPLYQRAAQEGWAIYALDMPEIDTTSPMGELVLTILAAIARMEKRLIGQRTSAALRAKAARGEPVGRRRAMPEATLARLRELRASGASYQAIADALNAEGIPGSQGGSWFKQSVAQAVKRYGVAS